MPELLRFLYQKSNAKEAALIEGVNVYGAEYLCDVVNHFTENKIQPTKINVKEYLAQKVEQNYLFDFKDVKGQQKAKKHWKLQPQADIIF